MTKHTILGANGIIGEGLAKELRSNFSGSITLVGRDPKKVNSEDFLFKADLLNREEVLDALQNTDIAYLTVGLPYDSEIWLKKWTVIMDNVIYACKTHGCKLVYFDNTYAYSQNTVKQTEHTPFDPDGDKGLAKKRTAELLLNAMSQNDIKAVICRAPEFYGPGKTKGLTNSLIFENLKNRKTPKVLVKDTVLRTLIYTPDASRAMALIGNTEDAYGQTWHLPCDDDRMTYKEIMQEISDQLGRKVDYTVLNSFVIKFLALFNSNLNETKELLPRYAIDNIFESSKFQNRFPEFKITPYKEGIKAILNDFEIE